MRRPLIKILLVNTVIALLPPLLLVVLSIDNLSFHRLLITLLYFWIYANCIVGLNFATSPQLWQAVRRYPAWQRWPLRILALFVNCLAGGLIACLIFVAIGLMPRDLYWQEFLGSLKLATFLTMLVSVSMATYETLAGRLEYTGRQSRTRVFDR